MTDSRRKRYTPTEGLPLVTNAPKRPVGERTQVIPVVEDEPTSEPETARKPDLFRDREDTATFDALPGDEALPFADRESEPPPAGIYDEPSTNHDAFGRPSKTAVPDEPEEDDDPKNWPAWAATSANEAGPATSKVGTTVEPVTRAFGKTKARPGEPEMLLPIAGLASRAAAQTPEISEKPQTDAAPPRTDPNQLSVARFAELRASIHYRPDEQQDILDRAEIDDSAWEDAEDRWDSRINAGVLRGDLALLHECDQAYYAQLESERGEAIELACYAALELAVERDDVSQELARQRIPEPSFFPVKRRWTTRLLADAELRRALAEALDRLRRGG
jgi:hypothetical protein